MEEDGTDWDAFVESQPDASFFHLYSWKQVLEQQLGHRCHFAAARHTGVVQGVLPPAQLSSRLLGKSICSLPFVDYSGPCSTDAETAVQLLNHAASITRDYKAGHLEVRAREDLGIDWPCQTHKVLLKMDISEGQESIWAGFKGKHRTAIRRTYKHGLTVRKGQGDLLDDFYEVLAASWHNLGSPFYSKEFFASVLEAFGDRTSIFVLYNRDSLPIATALNGYLNGLVDGLWAGMVPEARLLQPNYVLYWEMIIDACDRGFKSYSLGRSTQGSPAESFKRKWGAVPDQLYWFYYSPNGLPMPEPKTEQAHFKFARSVWRRLPRSVVRAFGPPIARLLA